MSFELGLNLWGIPPLHGRELEALRDDLRRVAGWGYSSIEATCGPGDRLRFGDDPLAARRLRQAAEDVGLSIVSLCSGATWEWHLNSPDPDRRRRARLAVEELIGLAAELGEGVALLLTPGTTTMPGQRGRGVTSAGAWELARQTLRPLAEMADQKGVDLALENSWTRFLVSPREACEFLDELALPALGWYLDLGNACLTADPLDWIETLGPRIRMVQAKDFKPTPEGGRLGPPGTGDLDWPSMMKALEAAGYEGPIVVEAPPDPKAAEKAAAFLLQFPEIKRFKPTKPRSSPHASRPAGNEAAHDRPHLSGRNLCVAVVGLGFMGRLHTRLLLETEGFRLAAIVDPTGRFVLGERHFIRGVRRARRVLGMSLDQYPPDEVRRLRSCGELISGNVPDAVWLCTPTCLHAGQAQEFIAAGCHVFCEKPLALSSRDARDVIDTAAIDRRRLAVGQCVRFWPEWRFLTERIHDAHYGRLLELDFWRVCGRPVHAEGGWLDDPERSGGAVLDLHVHDTDFLLGLPWKPATVLASIRHDTAGAPQYIRAKYTFEGTDAPEVRCRAGWYLPPATPFRSGYRALFERGLLSCNDGEEGLYYFPEAGGGSRLRLEGEAFADQAAAVHDFFVSGIPHPLLDPLRAAMAIAMVEAEQASDRTSLPVDLTPFLTPSEVTPSG